MPAGELSYGRTVWRVVRGAVAAFVAQMIAVPAVAASNSSSFTVGATVVASCAIVSQRLGRRSASPCATALNAPAVPTPQPVVRIDYDPVTKIKTMTLEF